MGFREMRRAANLTQKEVAAQIGVNQSAVALWETGKTSPRTKRLAQIAKVYRCSVTDLVANVDTPVHPTVVLHCSGAPPDTQCRGDEKVAHMDSDGKDYETGPPCSTAPSAGP